MKNHGSSTIFGIGFHVIFGSRGAGGDPPTRRRSDAKTLRLKTLAFFNNIIVLARYISAYHYAVHDRMH